MIVHIYTYVLQILVNYDCAQDINTYSIPLNDFAIPRRYRVPGTDFPKRLGICSFGEILEALFVDIYKPIASMYGIFTYIYHKTQQNVDKYTIHGSKEESWFGIVILFWFVRSTFGLSTLLLLFLGARTFVNWVRQPSGKTQISDFWPQHTKRWVLDSHDSSEGARMFVQDFLFHTWFFPWGWTKMQRGGIFPFGSGLLPFGDGWWNCVPG